MMKCAVVIEKADTNYSAYVPDLAGCISTGRTLDEAEQNIWDAIAFYIEGLREGAQNVPEPTTHVAELENCVTK